MVVARSLARLALLAAASAVLVACNKNPAPPAADAAVADAAPAPPEDSAAPFDAAIVDAAASTHVHAGPLAVPGPCVDPAVDAKAHGTGRGPVVASEPDLDGDGKPDKIFAFMTTGVSNPFVIYVMRGACGHFVGTLNTGGLVAEKSHSHGLADLHGHIPCKAKCNCTTQDFTAHFNGTTYSPGVVTETLQTCAPGQTP